MAGKALNTNATASNGNILGGISLRRSKFLIISYPPFMDVVKDQLGDDQQSLDKFIQGK